MSDQSKWTERAVLDLLEGRYSMRSQGTGVRYVRAEHVRSQAGFDAPRCADFVAMDLWWNFGRGCDLHGHEVKVSRSDWLTELRQPEKCQPIKRYMDRWWLVVSDASIVKPGELPEDWGLMTVAGSRLRVKVDAPKLLPDPIPKAFLAPLLRATQATAERRGVTPSLLHPIYDEGA